MEALERAFSAIRHRSRPRMAHWLIRLSSSHLMSKFYRIDFERDRGTESSSYDIVDQIMLARHPLMIHQFRVHFSKTLRKPQSTSFEDRVARLMIDCCFVDLSPSLRCTHLTNLPADVTSRELASIYRVHPADILLKPANPLQCHLKSPGQSLSAEAWVKGTSHPSKQLGGVQISSEIVDGTIDNLLNSVENFSKANVSV